MYSKIDLKYGYYQSKISSEDVPKTVLGLVMVTMSSCDAIWIDEYTNNFRGIDE